MRHYTCALGSWNLSQSVYYIRNHAFLLFLKGFTSLAVRTFQKIYASPQRRSRCVISQSAAFFTHHRSRLRCPQVVFAQSLLDPLQVHLREVVMLNDSVQEITVEFYNIFLNNTKHLSHTNGLLEVHLAHVDTKIVIKTDASVWEEKAGVGIVLSSLNWPFSFGYRTSRPFFKRNYSQSF